jgi:hypothetical protein
MHNGSDGYIVAPVVCLGNTLKLTDMASSFGARAQPQDADDRADHAEDYTDDANQ